MQNRILVLQVVVQQKVYLNPIHVQKDLLNKIFINKCKSLEIEIELRISFRYTLVRSTSESMMVDEQFSDVEIDIIHVAAALVSLKARHNLSNNCMEDIVALLKFLGVNVPATYKAACTALKKRSNTYLSRSTHTVCPYCQELSSETHKCTACDKSYLSISLSKISLFYTFSISEQLKAILASSPDLVLNRRHDSRKKVIDDITCGHFYNKLLEKESDSFITLTMNADGIQPNKGSDLSVWPIMLVINEIKRKKRYTLENSILAGMWPGPSKPSRSEMSLFLRDIVAQLKALEQGDLYELYSLEHENCYERLKVFLIAACCDKPAQCLIQCLADPTGYFGCGHCEIEGQ